MDPSTNIISSSPIYNPEIAVECDSSLEDIGRLCRGCMTPILNQSFSMKNEAMRELFRKCTYLQIEEDDVLSKYLCKSCFTDLHQWKKFQLLCEESQNKFFKICYKRKETKIEENDSEMECDEEQEIPILPNCEVTINTEPVPDPLKVRVKTMTGQNSNIQPIKQPPKFVLMCKECKQIFVNLDVYENHYRSKHPKDPNDYIFCCVCRAMFTTDDECLQHLIATHTVDIFPVNFTCDICQMEFYERTRYMHHCQIHEQLTCKICKKEFSQYSYLDTHSRVMHTDPKFECEFCKKKFRTEYDLTVHKRKHTNEKVGCCQYCGKTFFSQKHLKVHVENVHELEPVALPCHLCSYIGKTKKRLQMHIHAHKVERNISCDLCPLKFKTKSTYQNHRMTHTGEKRFHCKICSHGFIKLHSLQTHMKVHEQIP